MIKDNVGERLITLNSSVLNTPGFRAAGWAGPAAFASSLKRAHSPPIPVATAIASEYFKPSGVDAGDAEGRRGGFSDEEEGGMITGVRDDTNTIAHLRTRTSPGKRGRRRRDLNNQQGRIQHKHGEGEEDSSDLSDDSDDDGSGTR